MLNPAFIVSIVSLCITFATILSHYWISKMRLQSVDDRLATIEKLNILEIREKIIKIEIMLENISEKVSK